MKRHITALLTLAIVMCVVGCARQGVRVASTPQGDEIAQQLNAMTVGEVLEDISDIDLYLSPSFDGEYTTRTVKNTDTDTVDVEYYQDDKLIYTKYEGYGEDGFSAYIETKSDLDATVSYYNEAGNRMVDIRTSSYSVFINRLGRLKPYGIADASIIINSLQDGVFDNQLSYHYLNGKAYLTNAVYQQAGDYVRYTCDLEGEEFFDTTDVLVSGKAVQASDDVMDIVTTHKDYTQVDMRIGADGWYYNSGRWFAKSTLYLTFDSDKKANEYLNNYPIKNATLEEYDGVYTVAIPDAIVEFSESALLENGKLPSYIVTEVDDDYTISLQLNNNGIVTALDYGTVGFY